MTSPWLTVIIPVHNGELYLEAALQSLCAQNDPEIECLVVDSSESKTCSDIVQRYAQIQDIRMYRRPEIKPWTEKTNFAVSNARGEMICMLHQDDLWRPGRAMALRRNVQARPEGVMHLNPSVIVDQNGRTVGIWRGALPVQPEAIPVKLLLERLLVQNFIAIPAPAIRREAFLSVGGMDVNLWYTADWDLYLKLALAGPVYYQPEALTCFRIHAGSQTMTGSRGPVEFRAQMQTVLDRYAASLPARDRNQILRAAQASIDMNVALAKASHGGGWGELASAFASVIALGPGGARRYLRDSRLTERVGARLRARFAGNL